ncbi:MFS transporter [Enterococcus sp. ALS3]|uniref:MFS transporter n=1 Tax=Enterococcus alishanensis TaxID=1303817 RepID=A0ABS6TCT2_9ENTE|nr:MFS transporter [Enterococcus alishanensis]
MNKWMKFFLLYLGGTLIGMSQLKIAPVINPLSQYLHTSLTQMSLLTSVFTISGIFIAIPGGALVTKIGAKKLLLGIIALLAIGNFLGTVAGSFSMLLVTRVIEGISFSTIVMTAVVLISYWFRDSQYSGTAIGIFTTFPALASLISMNLFLSLSEKYGHFASWYLIGGLSVILWILYFFFLDAPKAEDQSVEEKIDAPFRTVLKNKSVWILGVLQGCMAFVLYAYIALYPVLFSDYYHLSQGTANFYSGLFGLFGIPFGVVAGFLLDRVKKSGLVILVAFSTMALACLAAPFLGGVSGLIIAQVFFLSAAAMLASSSITILVPRAAGKEQLIGYSMSFVNLFYYTMIVIGAPLISKIVEQFSWLTGLSVLTGVACIGVIGSIIYLVTNQTIKN